MGELSHRYDDVALDRAVWSRSGKPIRGVVFRYTLTATFVLLALTPTSLVTKIVLGVTAVLVFFAVPLIVNQRLDKLSEEIGTVSASRASSMLGGFDNRRLVALFAPHAWVSWQKGRLHLRKGDGRAAAHSFSEAARQVGDAEQPALVGAQAHALMSAHDPKAALEKLRDLEKKDALTARDRMNLGIALIEKPGKAKAAIEHLEAASEAFEDKPRPLAGLALALAREGRSEDAETYLERAEDADDVENDDVAQDLIKRAGKALRGTKKAEDKPTKTGKSRREPEKRQERGKKKKDRRKSRREKRRAAKKAKAKEHVNVEPAPKHEPVEPKPAPKVEPKPEPKPAPAAPKDSKPAPKPAPPAVSFEGADDKPVFRAPVVPPPPVVGAKKPASKPLASTDLDDLFGDD